MAISKGGPKKKSASDFFATNDESDSESGVVSEEEEESKGKITDDRFKAFSDDEDDDNDLSLNSEDEDEGKGKTSSSKRSHVDAFAQSDEDDDDDDEEDEVEQALLNQSAEKDFTDPDAMTTEKPSTKKAKKTKNKLKALTSEEVQKVNEKIKKSGLVYLSKIPPFMKPVKVRQILSRFGEVNRIFLVPEDSKIHAKRVKYGGNKKINYVEGWAEFMKKGDAKLAADTLNGNIIGGKKNSHFHDDILSVKYLHKFKWHNLTEQMAYERQVRQSKLRAEIAQATRENKEFVKNVEKSMMIEGIKSKKREKNKDIVEEDIVRRSFDQRDVKTTRSDTSKPTKVDNDKVSNILSKVF